MDFHVLGDATAYEAFGKACANYIEGAGPDYRSCYNAIRPVGIQLYYAIPYLLSTDVVTQKIITLLMNVLCLWLLVASCLSLYKSMVAGTKVLEVGWRAIISKIILIFGLLVLSIGYVPIRMPDLQSAAFFVASISLLANDKARASSFLLGVAGFCAGVSILLKQNYMVPSFLAVFLWLVLNVRFHLDNRLKALVWFLAGFSVCAVQMIMVYAHSGIPWFYDPTAMTRDYSVANFQPYIELVAFTDPRDGAYITSLAHPLSTIDFVAVKFYEGFYKFYWTVFLGAPPFDVSPTVVNYSRGELNFIIFTVLALFLGSSLTYRLKNKWIFIVAMTSFLSALATALIMHTENRYYFINKILSFVVLVIVVNLLIDKVLIRFRGEKNSAVADSLGSPSSGV